MKTLIGFISILILASCAAIDEEKKKPVGTGTITETNEDRTDAAVSRVEILEIDYATGAIRVRDLKTGEERWIRGSWSLTPDPSSDSG